MIDLPGKAAAHSAALRSGSAPVLLLAGGCGGGTPAWPPNQHGVTANLFRTAGESGGARASLRMGVRGRKVPAILAKPSTITQDALKQPERKVGQAYQQLRTQLTPDPPENGGILNRSICTLIQPRFSQSALLDLTDRYVTWNRGTRRLILTGGDV